MIQFCNNFYTRKELQEIEIASENLPNKFYILGFIENPNLEFGYDFLIVGKDKNNLVKYEDVSNYFCGKICQYAKPIDNFEQNFMDGYRFNLNKVPSYIQSIDLFFIRQKFHIVSKATFQFEVKFLSESKDYLFSYHFKTEPSNKNNFFCGTFAKVSNGWKFYPKFKNFSEDRSKILQKYKGGSLF